jgi:hypothetical protein
MAECAFEEVDEGVHRPGATRSALCALKGWAIAHLSPVLGE